MVKCFCNEKPVLPQPKRIARKRQKFLLIARLDWICTALIHLPTYVLHVLRVWCDLLNIAATTTLGQLVWNHCRNCRCIIRCHSQILEMWYFEWLCHNAQRKGGKAKKRKKGKKGKKANAFLSRLLYLSKVVQKVGKESHFGNMPGTNLGLVIRSKNLNQTTGLHRTYYIV